MRTYTLGEFSTMDVEKIYDHFGVDESGVTTPQVEPLRKEFGSNTFSSQRGPSLWKLIRESYCGPFSIILFVLAIITFLTDFVYAPAGEKDFSSPLIVLIILIISGTISLVQSVRSHKATAELEKLVHVTAAVYRDGEYREIPTEEIVCGDRVKLAAGDIIPADMRLIHTKDLFVSESALTGESYPVEKVAEPRRSKIRRSRNKLPTSVGGQNSAETEALASPDTVSQPANDSGANHPVHASSDSQPANNSGADQPENIAYMASNIVSGAGIGVVVRTGENTEFGDIASRLSGHSEPTAFDIGLDKTSRLLVRFMLIMTPAVLLVNGLSKGNWTDAFIFAVSVAVGLTPQLLPMVVTTNLVKGSATLARRGTIVRNLNAIQNFGAMDILCTDKTGTLTQDEIVLERHLNCHGEEDPRVLRYAYLNSYYQTGLKNLLDKAVIRAAEDELNIDRRKYTKVDEVPFDFNRRRMSVVMRDEAGRTELITKGAAEEMLAISSFVELDGQVKPLTEGIRQMVQAKVRRLNEDGMRVLVLARKDNPPRAEEFQLSDERDMVLIGYLAFLDPPKKSAEAAIAALHEANIEVKVVTGDNLEVTRTVCRQVGIHDQRIISGEELAALPRSVWAEAVEKHNIFVKISPGQKADIVEQLRENGHVTGFLGDGINDSPALAKADIGISVDTAVDIAKESADIILLEKDLTILERGVLSGREIFGNIMKYIKISVSSNFGNVFSILVASLFLPFLPMLPTQILVLNLIYDISCMSIPWDRMDREYLAHPKRWDASDIKNFMVYFGPVSSIFDCITFAVLYFLICPAIMGMPFGQAAGTPAELGFESLFHTGWFIVSLWTQTFVLWTLRTEKLPFIHSWPSFTMSVITCLGVAFGTALPYTALGNYFKLSPLPGFYYWLLAAVLVGYFVLVSLMKPAYVRKHGKLL
ncbi:magnesium-translocating P-type ATPase [Actinobaculum suis]|uniref:magnesium-translocating P-type ATPase n=1 Tax=Actinobaculum suis TaxID=1657 RepID=UPI0008086ADF|nr:magnesium-translocating P-type ATPase [Actinobaculum suis]OCA95041.1 magnesium-translocating P-type ATPase [Actinobaculum suis]OCA95753.1 magnesium-translocating P-type ATPase [Actinobaculum suis]